MPFATLERVTSVRQTSMASTALPLELQQQIFTLLDSTSFYNARRVCKWWKFASTDLLPLARQLKRLPILPQVDPAKSSPAELENLFDEAARSLLLGVKYERAHDSTGSLTRAAKMGFTVNPRVIATSDGKRTIQMEGRLIRVFDTSGDIPRLESERPVNDLKETVGSGPWLRMPTSTYRELALSADGGLLAIAQERTIQIYDLNAEPDSFTLNEYVSSAAGHYICGLDFEQNDHVLRVRLSGKGTVVYLGTPPAPHVEEPATFEHWRSKAGLKHVFLDSSLIRITNDDVREADQAARVSGIQLLRPFEGGYMFAGQHHGGGESSYYILGHVRTTITTPHDPRSVTAQPNTVIVLARLESFLSSWRYTLEASTEGGMGLWENMPSAHEHHPRFAMTAAGNFSFLALAERDKKRIRPAPLIQLFIYRLPAEQELKKSLAKKRAAEDRDVDWATVDSFLEKLEAQEKKKSARRPSSHVEIQYSVPRIPLCLSTLQNDVTELEFSIVDERTCAISASTVETTRTWLLHDS